MGMSGYQALREGCAWLDLTGRGVIRVTGEDRVRLLHALVTNHVEQLQPGEHCYAFFLNTQGRILADVNLLRLKDHLLLDTEPETREFVYSHLDKYIIADDVSLEDLSAHTAVLGVEGPKSAETMAAAGELPLAAHISATGATGFRIFAPRAEKEDLVRRLEAAGAVAASAEEARTVRLEFGRPRYGEDISDKYLPQETQLLHAVHFTKGCYLGQEIVERVRARGMVHRALMRLTIDAVEPPAPGTKITAGQKEVGEVTSAAFSPAAGKVLALGYLRPVEIGTGAPLAAGDHAVEIVARTPGRYQL